MISPIFLVMPSAAGRGLAAGQAGGCVRTTPYVPRTRGACIPIACCRSRLAPSGCWYTPLVRDPDRSANKAEYSALVCFQISPPRPAPAARRLTHPTPASPVYRGEECELEALVLPFGVDSCPVRRASRRASPQTSPDARGCRLITSSRNFSLEPVSRSSSRRPPRRSPLLSRGSASRHADPVKFNF